MEVDGITKWEWPRNTQWNRVHKIRIISVYSQRMSSVLRLQCFDTAGWPLKTEWWGAGVVICLKRGANDLHMVQLTPLPPGHLLLHWNPDWFNLSGAGLPRLSWKKMLLNGCLSTWVQNDQKKRINGAIRQSQFKRKTATETICICVCIITCSAVSSCLRNVPAAAASVASLKSSAACRRLSSCVLSCGVLAQPCQQNTNHRNGPVHLPTSTPPWRKTTTTPFEWLQTALILDTGISNFAQILQISQK